MSQFDEVINRKNTYSLKYDFAAQRGIPEDALPMWVADMDFRASDKVLEALQKETEHGIFGYSEPDDDYYRTVQNWFLKRHGYRFEKEWIVKTPGVVFAISMAIRALTKEGEAVMIQQPVYYPFGQTVRQNGRRLVNNPLQFVDGTYQIDFEDMERKLSEEDVKLFVFCSPHNPVGRVWHTDELIRVIELCKKYQVWIVSDEIHADFVYEGHTHMPLATISGVYEDKIITCTAASKTFNLAGLQTSNIIIKNEKARDLFIEEIQKTGYCEINIFGLLATKAAYEHGAQWLEECKAYLTENLSYVRTFLKERLPEIRLIEPDGTYLLWLNFKDYGFTDEKLHELLTKKAKLWLDDGTMFGPEGSGFARMNITCPRSVLEQAMNQLESAFRDL